MGAALQISQTVIPQPLGYIPQNSYVHKEGFPITNYDDHPLDVWRMVE